jgi:hypothetical protein
MQRYVHYVIAALALTVIAVSAGGVRLPRVQADAPVRMIGPHGEPIVVQLPELAKIPPLDLAAACDVLARPDAREARKEHEVALAGCAGRHDKDYAFYDDLGDMLTEFAEASAFDANQMIAAMREALLIAPTAEDVSVTMRGLSARATSVADRLHAPDYYLLGAEMMAAHLQFCTGDKAAACRRDSHENRGLHLSGAGRWRGDADLMRAGIAAYREALKDAAEKSSDWVDLLTHVGSALAQLSERTDDTRVRRTLLREALQEYVRASSAVKENDRSTWAMINQNVCSIRQPLAALDQNRWGTREAIAECEKARAYYEDRGEKTNEAAAHYNMARAYERLAEWDRDEASAMQAVVHVRRAVALYGEDNATMSQAFGRIHLAEALMDAGDLARTRKDGDERHKELLAEANASLDAAEPVLRKAQASGYLDRLESVRRRVASR